MSYLLNYTLKKHFGTAIKPQKHIRNRKLLPKYLNWSMLFKNIQYAVWKADIIPLLILSLDEFNIITTNDILYCLGNHLVLADIIKDQIILIKGDFLTVRNITCVIYQKYDKKCIIQVFFI